MAEKDPHVIGARIAKRRHQLDWSQVELARRLGVSPSTVANWERGSAYPKKKLGKVEQVLGVSLDGEPEQRPAVPPALLREIMNTEGLTMERRLAVIAAVEATLAREQREAGLSAEQAPPAEEGRPERRRSAS